MFKRMTITIYRALPVWIRDPLVWVLSPKHGIGVVGVIFNPERKVLVLHQTYDEPIRLPGGIMEYGETPEDTLVREMLEEVQCLVQPVSILGTSRKTKRKLDIFLLAHLVEQRPFVANAEVHKVEWRDPADPDNLADLPVLHQLYIQRAVGLIHT
jgi:8-oxo-dGTP diphosphatase